MSIDDVWDRLIRDPGVVEDAALGAALQTFEPVGLAGDRCWSSPWRARRGLAH